MAEPITLEYNLAELPSSQHRAGLAGLVLMVQWHNTNPDKKGVCDITHLSETGATLEIDQEGLQSLFDKVYAASKEEVGREAKLKNKAKEEIPPLREEIRTITDEKTGKTKEKTFYIYPQVIPRGAFLVDYDPTSDGDNGIWIKLWRNMIWSILRGVPATRRPYDERSEGGFTEDADKVWQELNRQSGYTVELPSTYFIGAQASNAEDVPFKDRARFQFLLHFWSFVAQIYVPMTWNFDRKTNRESPKDTGFALVIPDVANLEVFCVELPQVLQQREVELFGYRPKESIVDVAAEGALELMDRINQRLATRINYQISDLLLGVDVVHLEKQGNNIRLWGNSRIDPNREMIDEYSRVKTRFSNTLFRRQRKLNVLNENKAWFDGFNALLSKTDSDQTIGSPFFRSDVRKAFEDVGVNIKSRGGNQMEAETKETVPKTLERVIYQLVRTYIYSKLEGKYQLTWNSVKSNPAEERKYNEMKGKIAREAFLAIRSRTDADFTEYFASTLCSYYQFSLSGDGFDLIAKALQDENEKVRTLTMLALSANGSSPRDNQEKSQ
jgi:CRISPR-associated protein Cmx8